MIGFDDTMLLGRFDKPSDTRERHIKYLKALRAKYPQGSLTVLLKVPFHWSSTPEEITRGFTVYPVPSRRISFAIEAWRILKKINPQRFDLITTQTPFDDGWLGVRIKEKYRIPLNVQSHSSFLDYPNWLKDRPLIHSFFNRIGKKVVRKADTLRVVSLGEKERLLRLFPFLKNKIFYLHPYFNLKLFSLPVREESLEQMKTIFKTEASIPPYIFYAGRLSREKNLPLLLRAFSLLRKKEKDVFLVIAGEGTIKEKLKRFISPPEMAEHTVFLGNVPLSKLPVWYRFARVTVLPSLYEGFGRSVVESYLMETPVIVTPFVSAKELVKDGETGFILSSFEDAEELAEKLLFFIHSPDKAEVMGRRGREYIRRYLIPEDIYLKKLVEIWEETRKCAS